MIENLLPGGLAFLRRSDKRDQQGHPDREHGIDVHKHHRTATVTFGWLGAPPTFTTTGTLDPTGASMGTSAFTWSRPTNPGAMPANCTRPGRFPKVAVTVCVAVLRGEERASSPVPSEGLMLP